MDGMQLLDELNRRCTGLPVLILTAHGTIPDAVSATQEGAIAFLTKPVDKTNLLDHVERALQLNGGRRSDRSWRSDIISRSTCMEELLNQARRLAKTESSFPLERLRELADGGVIGGVTSEAYGFMGGIYSTRRVEAETAPLLVERCRSQETDLALLVPV
jgi:response regulator RpfG family c-di-GMP phosphodiesterase